MVQERNERGVPGLTSQEHQERNWKIAFPVVAEHVESENERSQEFLN
jgi:hypothetical protein